MDDAERDLVIKANSMVSVVGLLRRLGMTLPDIPPGTNVKVRCLYGFTHADGGMETSLRVYPDNNSCFCFAGCGYLSPVGIAKLSYDLPTVEAARKILEDIGYVDVSTSESWERAVELIGYKPALDLDSLGQALLLWCQTHPSWASREFDLDVQTKLSCCMELLPRCLTEADAANWLNTTKQVMEDLLA